MHSSPKTNPDKEEKSSTVSQSINSTTPMAAITTQAALIASATTSEPVYDQAYVEKIYQEIEALPDTISNIVIDNPHYGATINIKSNLITSYITSTYIRYNVAEDSGCEWILKHELNSAELVDFRVPETVCAIDTKGISIVYSSDIKNDVLIATKNLPSIEEKKDADQHNDLVLSNLHLRAAQNDANALYKLGCIYGNGIEVDANDKFAFSCYLKAAKQNHAYAIWKIGRYCAFGYAGIGYLSAVGIKFWSLAAKRGCVPAKTDKDSTLLEVKMLDKSVVYKVPRHSRVDPDGADILNISNELNARLKSITLNGSDFCVFKMACLGVDAVPDNVAVIYMGHNDAEKQAAISHNNRFLAKQLQRAQSNDPYEQYKLGYYLKNYSPTPGLGSGWFQKAADQNYPRAMRQICIYYPNDFNYLANYITQAIIQGSQNLKRSVESVFSHGLPTEVANQILPGIHKSEWGKVKKVCEAWKKLAELINNQVMVNTFSKWLAMAESKKSTALLEEFSVANREKIFVQALTSSLLTQSNSFTAASVASSSSSSTSMQPRTRPDNLRPTPKRKKTFSLLDGTVSSSSSSSSSNGIYFQLQTKVPDKKQKVSPTRSAANAASTNNISTSSSNSSSSSSSSGIFSKPIPIISAASSIDAKKDAMRIKQEFVAPSSPVITENDLREVTDFLRGDSKSRYNCARFAIDIKEYQKTGRKPTQRTNPAPGTFRQSTLAIPTEPVHIKTENDEFIVSNEVVQMKVFQSSELFEDAIPEAVFYESSQGGIYVEGIDLVDDNQALTTVCRNYKTINHEIQHLADDENKILVGTLILVYHHDPEIKDTATPKFAKRYGVHFVPFRATPQQQSPLYMDCTLEDNNKRIFTDLSKIYTFIDSKEASLTCCFIKTCSFVLHAKFSHEVVNERNNYLCRPQDSH